MGNTLELTEENTECVFCPKCGHKFEIRMDKIFAKTRMSCKKCNTSLTLLPREEDVHLVFDILM